MSGEAPRSYGTIPLFEGLPDDAIAALDAAIRTERHPSGSVLFRQGQPGDAMYLLLEGKLEVRVERGGREVAIDALDPPAPVGETALLTGRPRSATVVAVKNSTVGVLPADIFAQLVQDHEVLLRRLEEAVRPRIRRTRLVSLLRDWFDVKGSEEVHALEERMTWLDLPSGEALFGEGDRGDDVYLVVSGRLRFEVSTAHGPRVLGEISAPECVGEMSMLTGEARSATVRAIRDASLVRIPADLAREHAAFMARLARTVAERSRRQVIGRDRGRPARTFALVGLTPDAPLQELAEKMRTVWRPFGSTMIVDRGEFDRRFDLEDICDARPGELAESVLLDWLDRQERLHGHLLYLTDPTVTPWTDRCLRQADHVILVADADRLQDANDRMERVRALAPHTRTSLALLRPDDRDAPSDTAAWLERFVPHAHHHLRLARADEIGRFARHLSGRALTLVLSGGGARGYVHIGLLTAIEEAGIEIDAIAGTSMGALVGGAYAMRRSADAAEQAARTFGDRKLIVDTTLPMVSIARSRGVTQVLRSLFDDIRIEDLPTPFFCVSSNLSRAKPELHHVGPVWRAVRASSAIPGVFSPVLQNGEVLVDGGAMNNFPVDLARDRFGDGPLIASNAYGEERPLIAYDFPDEVSGWQVLLDRLRPKARRRFKAPSILTTLTQSTSLNAHYLMDRIGQGADLLVRYPTDGVGSLEFGRVDELIAMGRTEAAKALANYVPWPEMQRGLRPKPTPRPRGDG